MTVFGAIAGENQIEAIRFLSDNEGQEFADQVCRYLENLYGIDMIQDLIGREDEAKEQEEKRLISRSGKRKMKRRWMKCWHPGALWRSLERKRRGDRNPLGVLQKLKHRVLTEIVLPRDRVISQKVWKEWRGMPDGRDRKERGICRQWRQMQVKSCI